MEFAAAPSLDDLGPDAQSCKYFTMTRGDGNLYKYLQFGISAQDV